MRGLGLELVGVAQVLEVAALPPVLAQAGEGLQWEREWREPERAALVWAAPALEMGVLERALAQVQVQVQVAVAVVGLEQALEWALV